MVNRRRLTGCPVGRVQWIASDEGRVVRTLWGGERNMDVVGIAEMVGARA